LKNISSPRLSKQKVDVLYIKLLKKTKIVRKLTVLTYKNSNEAKIIFYFQKYNKNNVLRRNTNLVPADGQFSVTI